MDELNNKGFDGENGTPYERTGLKKALTVKKVHHMSSGAEILSETTISTMPKTVHSRSSEILCRRAIIRISDSMRLKTVCL